MKNFQLWALLLVVAIIFACNSNTKSKEGSNLTEEVKNEEQLIRSKEFKDYFFSFFSLTGPNIKDDLNHVNKFMGENKLWKFKDICDLLENEKIQSDSIVYKHWEIRCKFQRAKNTLMDKYGLTADSINIIMEHAISDPPKSWGLDKTPK